MLRCSWMRRRCWMRRTGRIHDVHVGGARVVLVAPVVVPSWLDTRDGASLATRECRIVDDNEVELGVDGDRPLLHLVGAGELELLTSDPHAVDALER